MLKKNVSGKREGFVALVFLDIFLLACTVAS
jgi:hypothetical protein